MTSLSPELITQLTYTLELYSETLGDDFKDIEFSAYAINDWDKFEDCKNMSDVIAKLTSKQDIIDILTWALNNVTQQILESQGYYKQVVVELSEEYGYRTWYWFTGMNKPDLIRFWEDMDSVNEHFWNPSKTLPGQLVPADAYPGAVNTSTWYGHIHENSDSYLQSTDPDTTEVITYHHKGLLIEEAHLEVAAE